MIKAIPQKIQGSQSENDKLYTELYQNHKDWIWMQSCLL